MSDYLRRILIVEDDSFVGSLMADALTSHKFSTMLVTDALQAKKAIESFDPDAALIDVILGEGPTGIDFLHYLMREHPGVAPILLTGKPVESWSDQIPGNVAFLKKDRIAETSYLLEAINSALKGWGGQIRHDVDSTSRLGPLTKSQKDVLKLMSQGFTNLEISRRRNTSASATEQVITAIYKNLGIGSDDAVMSRVEAIRIYISEVGIPQRIQ